MIGRQIGENRNVRRQRPGQLCLIAGQLQHHHLAVFGRLKRQHTHADIAAQLRLSPTALQYMVNQRRGRRFAIRTCDGNNPGRGLEPVPFGRCKGPEEQPDIIVDRNTRLHSGRNDRVRFRV